MKAWKLLLPAVLVVTAIAMVPQDPQTVDPALADVATVVSISELNYMTQQGNAVTVSARNVVEIRFLEDHAHHIRLELLYENGDYSLIDAQAFHLLRNGNSSREVRLVRGKQSRMRFPRLP